MTHLLKAASVVLALPIILSGCKMSPSLDSSGVPLSLRAPYPSPSPSPSPSQVAGAVVTTPRGYRITFNMQVQQGVDYFFSPVEPFPLMVVRKNGLAITQISHPGFPASELVAVKMPDAVPQGNPLQPFDPMGSNFGAYSTQYLFGTPYTMPTSLAAPLMVQLVRVDPQRAAAARAGHFVFPIFNPDFGDVMAILPSTPNSSRLFPPMLGTADLRNRVFTADEVDARVASLAWSTSVVTASNPITHSITMAQATAMACRGEFFQSPFQNISYGQAIVHGPLGNPNPWAYCPINERTPQTAAGVCNNPTLYRPDNDAYDSGNYPSTYGGIRHQEILKLAMWMIDPAAPLADRQRLSRCFVQNIGENQIGAAFMGSAINETGGQSGGFMLSAYLASFLLQSHTTVRSQLDMYKAPPTEINNPYRGGFAESSLIFQGIDGVWYYGSTAYGQLFKQANCQLIQDWHYCGSPYGIVGPMPSGTNAAAFERARQLQRFDGRADGGYYSTVHELFSTTASVMIMSPTFGAYVNYPPVVEFAQRIFLTGPKTYDPNYDAILRLHLAEAGGSQASINQAVTYLINTNHVQVSGSYGVEWLKTWYRRHLGLE